MRFFHSLTALGFFALVLGACAPAANTNDRPASALERLAIKGSDPWTMTASRADKTEDRSFKLELVEDPQLTRKGYYIAEASAGKFDALVFFFPENDTIAVRVDLDRAKDPQVVVCLFPETVASGVRFSGGSYFGPLSGIEKVDTTGSCVLNKNE
jgi:hypothetical protein